MDDRTIARWRLHAQGLTNPMNATAAGVVRGLLGVQAENHSQTGWALAARTTGLTQAAFDVEFDAGTFLRTHVLRPTWHYVHRDDLRWLLELTAGRILPSFRQVQRDFDVQRADLERGAEVIAAAVAADGPLTRPQVGERLGAEGLPEAGMGLMAMVGWAELHGVVCSGPVRDGTHTYARFDDRAGPQRLDRDEALTELARRYLVSHGPATERDLAYWATLTLTDVRAGIAAAADGLESFEHDGRTYWYGQDPPAGVGEPRGHLLLIFDETYRGYQDSREVLDADGVVPGGRLRSLGMVLLDGQHVGRTRRTLTADTVTFEITPFRSLADDEAAALHEAADRCAAFLEREPIVTLT